MDLFNAFWQDCHDQRLLRQLTGEERAGVGQAYARYRNLLRQAQAFSLDDSIIETMVDLSAVDARRMSNRLDIARLPFPVTWIELNFQKRFAYAQRLGLSLPTEDYTPERIGFLLIENATDPARWSMIEVVSKEDRVNSSDVRAGIMPGGFLVDLERRDEFRRADWSTKKFVQSTELLMSVQELLGRGDEQLLTQTKEYAHLGWGYATDKRPRDMTGGKPYISEWLDGSVGLGAEVINLIANRKMHTKMFAESIQRAAYECRGDVRFVVTALALLNDGPELRKTPRKPQGRFITSRGSHPFLESNVVTINIPGRKQYKLIDKYLRNLEVEYHKRRHRVRGHYRTSAKQPMGDGWEWRWSERYQAMRWSKWIETHERGDASLGWVEHSYVVQKAQQ